MTTSLSPSVGLWQGDYSDFIELDPQTNVATNYGGVTTEGVGRGGEVDFRALTGSLCRLSQLSHAAYQRSA